MEVSSSSGLCRRTSEAIDKYIESVRTNKEAEKAFIEKTSGTAEYDYILGSYDADRESFQISDSNFGTLSVRVPLGEARNFKALWDGLVKNPTFCVKNNQLGVESLSIMMPDGVTEYTAR